MEDGQLDGKDMKAINIGVEILKPNQRLVAYWMT
jgi:hypothetical protein